MDCQIRWLGDETMSFVVETGSKHSFVIDSSPEGGGRNLGPRPMEVMLSGAISCSAYDVVSYLKKNNQEVSSCVVSVTSQRRKEDPKVFKKIEIYFEIRGKNVDEKVVADAIRMTKEKSGSGYETMSYTAKIIDKYKVIKL